MNTPTEITLVSVLRQPTYLLPEDSVSRALNLLRNGTDTLPVLDAYGHLLGVLSPADFLPLLEERPIEGSPNAAVFGPVGRWARPPEAVGRADMTVEDVRKSLSESGETTLVILDRDDRYLGIVSLSDLLAPAASIPPRPPMVGGMATPFGVYLTNGTLQAGAGNLALVAGGLALGAMTSVTYAAVGLLTWGVQHLLHWHWYDVWQSAPPAVLNFQTLPWFLLQGLSLPLFLLLMRLVPISGYHAAEHQAVHAMERGEPLHPDIIRRMPRVHPRCGTNLMAAGLIFGLCVQLLPLVRVEESGGSHPLLDAESSAIIGILIALFFWRRVGAFLQQYFTTRPATDRQIASGIAAASDLERKYLTAVPRRPVLWRRLWCMGLPQTMLGYVIGSLPLLYLADWLFQFLK